MLLRSSVENKDDITFTMVSVGYKNNAVASKFYKGTLGATNRDTRGSLVKYIMLVQNDSWSHLYIASR